MSPQMNCGRWRIRRNSQLHCGDRRRAMPRRSLPCRFRQCPTRSHEAAPCRFPTDCRHAAKSRPGETKEVRPPKAAPAKPFPAQSLANGEERRRISPAGREGGSRRFASLAREVGRRQSAEKALRASEAKFAALFAVMPDAVALIRLADGRVLEASRSFPAYFGFAADEMVGRSTLPGDLGLWVDMACRRKWRENIERQGEVLDLELPARRKDGSIVTLLLSGKRIEIGGEPCTLVAVHDICERENLAARHESVAYHDPVTGLPNRLLLSDRLRQAIGQAQRSGSRIAICSLAVDGFADVEDRFGHEAAEWLLTEAANRLVASVRSGDTVARLGGAEFSILLCGLSRDDECQAALDRLLRAASATYALGEGLTAEVAVSIGVTIYPNDPVDPDTLLRHADHAMYAARQSGKSRYRLFDARIEQRIEARHGTLHRLADALESGQFCLFYQPQVDCRTGRCVGAEALIRWRHPTLGLLPPTEFLPLIEDTDLAPRVGEWVIREALSQIAEWRREGVDLTVSVNAFARQLLHPDFTDGLADALEPYAEAGRDRLQIEIVETAALKDLDAVRKMIEDCRRLGVAFSLDDFGTGYSTLAHVRHLPVKEIKIDQSFVRQMLTRADDLAIVEVVIRLGRAFGRSLVAEGVETQAHIMRLLDLGCDVMQGYALARPMPASELSPWIRAFRPDPAWLRPAVGAERT
jgi:diguanylate cyclase (GGDEF)-like protein/PAS domain S-box-containing protein